MPGETVTLRDLQRSKDDGRKIVGVVAWDYQIARIVDKRRAKREAALGLHDLDDDEASPLDASPSRLDAEPSRLDAPASTQL